MFRLISKMTKTPTCLARWASLGLPVNVKPITRRPHSVLRSFTSNNNIRHNRLEPRIERKLGEYENYYFEAGREKGWGHIRNCVVIRSEKELTQEQIRRALENLQKRHAVLRMAVTLKDGENYFAEVPDAPDFEILRTTDKRAVIACDEEQEWFTFGQLLWRSKLLQPETSDQGFLYPFIFTFHACMFDGTTLLANLYPDLVNHLETSFEQDGDNEIESLPFLPAREHVLYQYRDVDIECGQSAPNDWNSNKALAVKLIEMHKPSHPQRCSGIVGFVLDKEQTSQLLQKVAQHNVSLNSACVAAHAMALYRLLNDLGILTDQGWSLQSPFVVDLRPYAMPELPVSHSGVFVCELSNNITIPAKMAGCNSNEGLWEIAVSIKKENRGLLANPEPLLASMKNFNADLFEIFQSDRKALYRDCDPAEDLFYISMLGNLTFPPGRGKVSFDKMELMMGTREPVMFCHNIQRFNSASLLYWELSYSKMLVSDQIAEKYMSLVREELGRYLLPE